MIPQEADLSAHRVEDGDKSESNEKMEGKPQDGAATPP
jgi:hypothetical protein